MENKIKKIYIAVLLSMFLSFVIFAQDSSQDNSEEDNLIQNEDELQIDSLSNLNKNYFIKADKKGRKILVQRLSWEAFSDILEYSFILEKLNKDNVWKQIINIRQKENYKDVTLSPGKYGYKVAPINLLEQLEEYSDYQVFDIKIAHQPKVSYILPNGIYFDDIYPDTITLKGKNFHKNTIFGLKNKKNQKMIIGTPTYISKNGRKAKIKFNMFRIRPGNYNFSVIDPSNLRDEKQEIFFRFKKPVDTYVSGGYVFTGFAGNPVFKKYLNVDYTALGGINRISCMMGKRAYGAYGINLTNSVMHIKAKDKLYESTSTMLISQLQAAFILPIKKRVVNFDVHLGMAYLFLLNTTINFDISKTDKIWVWGLGLSGGTAFQVYVYKKLYIEFNMDHIACFRKDLPKYIYQPSLSLGWEF